MTQCMNVGRATWTTQRCTGVAVSPVDRLPEIGAGPAIPVGASRFDEPRLWANAMVVGLQEIAAAWVLIGHDDVLPHATERSCLAKGHA